MRAISVVTVAALLILPAAGALGQATSQSQGKTPMTGSSTAANTGAGSVAPSGDAGGAAGTQTTRGGCPTTAGQGADRSGEAKKEGTAQAGGQGQC
jgi:hypothetical protein